METRWKTLVLTKNADFKLPDEKNMHNRTSPTTTSKTPQESALTEDNLLHSLSPTESRINVDDEHFESDDKSETLQGSLELESLKLHSSETSGESSSCEYSDCSMRSPSESEDSENENEGDKNNTDNGSSGSNTNRMSGDDSDDNGDEDSNENASREKLQFYDLMVCSDFPFRITIYNTKPYYLQILFNFFLIQYIFHFREPLKKIFVKI